MQHYAYACCNTLQHITKKPLLFLLISFFSVNTFYCQAQDDQHSRLFLITVIDSDDEIIGERCQEDQQNITEAFDEYAHFLGQITVYPKDISGSDYSKASVNDALDNWLPSMSPTKDDVIVFYFSGHGFRLDGDVSTYPRMWLKTATNKEIEPNSIAMDDVYERITKMGAGVNLVLSDCCNAVPGAAATFTTDLAPRAKKGKMNSGRVKADVTDFDKLFSPDNPVSIIATAADSTELAGGTAKIGGFFTYYFVEGMDESIYEDDVEPTWQSILSYAATRASKKALTGACPDNKHNPKGRCIQTAKFNISGM